MAGVVKLNITETQDELKTLLDEQKTAKGRERIQALYLLKVGQVATVQDLAVVLGKHRVTVQRWLQKYRTAGIKGLLALQHGGGKTPIIPQWAVEALQQQLQQPQRFHSYGEVQRWLQQSLGVKASYKVVHALVYYKLKANLRVDRFQNSNPQYSQ